MELCSGGDLLNYVRKRRRLKENYGKYIFKQVNLVSKQFIIDPTSIVTLPFKEYSTSRY